MARAARQPAITSRTAAFGAAADATPGRHPFDSQRCCRANRLLTANQECFGEAREGSWQQTGGPNSHQGGSHGSAQQPSPAPGPAAGRRAPRLRWERPAGGASGFRARAECGEGGRARGAGIGGSAALSRWLQGLQGSTESSLASGFGRRGVSMARAEPSSSKNQPPPAATAAAAFIASGGASRQLSAAIHAHLN